jgi:hypothetical protein
VAVIVTARSAWRAARISCGPNANAQSHPLLFLHRFRIAILASAARDARGGLTPSAGVQRRAAASALKLPSPQTQGRLPGRELVREAERIAERSHYG